MLAVTFADGVQLLSQHYVRLKREEKYLFAPTPCGSKHQPQHSNGKNIQKYAESC